MASISQITLPNNVTYSLKDGSGDFVLKAGDTMTGNLNRKNTSMDTSSTVSTQQYSIIGFTDKNDRYIGYIQASEETSGTSFLDFATRRYNSSANKTNYLRLKMDSSSDATVEVSHPAAWRDAIGAVNIAGDTMTGGLNVPSLRLDADSNNICWLRAKTANRNAQVLKIYGASDGNGDAVLIGDGGLTIIGGGESAQSLYDAYVTNGTTSPGTECAMVGADTNVYIQTNCGTIADRQTWIFGTNRTLTYPGGGWISAGANGTVEITSNPDTSTSKTNYKMALALKGENDLPMFRIYNGSSWGSYTTLFPSTGGTITGNITRKNSVMDNTAATLSTAQYSGYYVTDKNNGTIGLFQTVQGTNGNTYTQILSRHTNSSNENIDHYLRVGVSATGARTLAVSDAALWRKTLGLGNTSTGALPILVSQGGTGRTTLTADYFLGGNGTSAVQMWDSSTAIDKLGIDTIVLYEGAASNGTITFTGGIAISSSCIMRVYYKDNNDKLAGFQDVYGPTANLTFTISAIEAAAKNSTFIRRTLYTISSDGSKITPSLGATIQIATTATSGAGSASTTSVIHSANATNALKVYRVVLLPMTIH